MDLDQLRLLFPRCNFYRSKIHDEIIYINFNFHGIRFSSTTNMWSENNFKHIYDTVDYVLQFLTENNFKFQEVGGDITYSSKNNITVYFSTYYYYVEISGNRFQVNADELITMIKKELNIETPYKPVLE